jgi:hypothetical protein
VPLVWFGPWMRMPPKFGLLWLMQG